VESDRRRFILRTAAWVAVSPLVLRCGAGGGAGADAEVAGGEVGPDAGPEVVDSAGDFAEVAAPPRAFDPARFALMASLLDALIPGDEASPGAAACHAEEYVDGLVGAFLVEPPRVFAGGPYSGRHGGLDGFSRFLPLTRVEELGWRTYLEGSQGHPEREWNGPVKGLKQRLEEGLDALEEAAQATHGAGFTTLAPAGRRKLFSQAEPGFVTCAYELACEGTYGDPVYGGNFRMLGWQAIDFEGDRQPVGFSARQLSHPEEG
jgi:hypothetical protein